MSSNAQRKIQLRSRSHRMRHRFCSKCAGLQLPVRIRRAELVIGQIMSIRNAMHMMYNVKQMITWNHDKQQHNKKQKNEVEIHTDADIVHSFHLGKREAENNYEPSCKQSRPNPREYNTPSTANDEKKFKWAVDSALAEYFLRPERIKSASATTALSTARSIYHWSTRPMRNELYNHHLSACGHVSLDPVPFSEWLFANIEKYILAKDIRANEQAHSADNEPELRKLAARNFLAWLQRTSRSSPGTALASAAAAAHATPASEEPMPRRNIDIQAPEPSKAPIISVAISPARPDAAGHPPLSAAEAQGCASASSTGHGISTIGAAAVTIGAAAMAAVDREAAAGPSFDMTLPADNHGRRKMDERRRERRQVEGGREGKWNR